MKQYMQTCVGLVLVILLRLLPHPPNVEPIMASLLPFAKTYGVVTGAVFGFASIFVYDITTGTFGTWTWVTALTYTAAGAAAALYLRKKNNHTRLHTLCARTYDHV